MGIEALYLALDGTGDVPTSSEDWRDICSSSGLPNFPWHQDIAPIDVRIGEPQVEARRLGHLEGAVNLLPPVTVLGPILQEAVCPAHV